MAGPVQASYPQDTPIKETPFRKNARWVALGRGKNEKPFWGCFLKNGPKTG
jgi:hypothetical protein